MRPGSIFFTVVHLFLSLFMVLLGVLIIIIAFSSQWRMALIQFFQEDSIEMVLVGSVIAFIGLFLMVALCFLYKRHMLTITMGEKVKISVDEKAIQKYIAEYWKQLFPSRDVRSTLRIHQNQIYIDVDLPTIKDADYKKLLTEIELGLTHLLEKYFDYREEFHLTISFQDVVSTE